MVMVMGSIGSKASIYLWGPDGRLVPFFSGNMKAEKGYVGRGDTAWLKEYLILMFGDL